MPEPRRRGRPAKDVGERKINRSIRLAPATWAQVEQLAAWWGVPAAQVFERLVVAAIEDAHGDEQRFQASPDVEPEDKVPDGKVHIY